MLQIGYLYEFDYKINDETGRDFLVVCFFIEMFMNKSSNMIANALKNRSCKRFEYS